MMIRRQLLNNKAILPTSSLFATRGFHAPTLVPKQATKRHQQEEERTAVQTGKEEGERERSWGMPTTMFGNEFFGDPFLQPFRYLDSSPFFRQATSSALDTRNVKPVLMDLTELSDRYELVAEIPGIPKDKVKLDFDSKRNILSLSGEMSYEHEERVPKGAKDEETKFLSTERRFGNFYRSVRLPEEIKPDEIKGSMENGILTVKIPKLKPEEREKAKFKINID